MLTPVLNIWYRNINAIGNGVTINFSKPLENGIYTLYYVRSVGSSDNGVPLTFAIFDNEVWTFLNSSGWVDEAQADATVRRNIKITKTGITTYAGGCNVLSNGAYISNDRMAIPYRLDRLIKF